MKKIPLKIALAAGTLAAAFFLSCADDFSSLKFPSLEEVKQKEGRKISGVSQKGPFVTNSSVVLYELNSSLVQTGKPFQGMTDNKGAFEIKGIELASPYVLLKADGYYLNEVTGLKDGPITLYAIADITDKSSMNVNVLTHLEYYRVLELAEQGMSLKDAKSQALGEILAVFGIMGIAKGSEDMSIFGTENGDAALLAISVLLQGGLSAGDFSDRLGKFSQGFSENGAWEDEAGKAAVKAWACSAPLADIRSNIRNWNISSSTPDFEGYVQGYCDVPPSSSLCTGFVEGTEVAHQGNYKKQLCDERDGKKYVYVPIGDNFWMAENLNYEATGSRCNNASDENCTKYGRLYNWTTAMSIASSYNSTFLDLPAETNHRGICPKGWHIPRNRDLNYLIAYVYAFATGSSQVNVAEAINEVGKYLKTKTSWNNDGNGSDNSGFSALPGGFGTTDGFFPPGDFGVWWTADDKATIDAEANKADYYELDFDLDRLVYSLLNKEFLFSVRCVKD